MTEPNVQPIGMQGITPEVIAEHFAARASDLRAVFIVGFQKDGIIMHMANGSAADMSLASLVLADIAFLVSKSSFQGSYTDPKLNDPK
jgi:hypothetical protein